MAKNKLYEKLMEAYALCETQGQKDMLIGTMNKLCPEDAVKDPKNPLVDSPNGLAREVRG